MLYHKIPPDESQTRGGGRVSIPKDDAFHILQNRRRRAVCRFLLAHPDQHQFRMADMAEVVAAWENDTTVQQLTPDQRQRVYVSLYQSHLPKLDTHDVIDYDKPRGLVEPTPLLAVFSRFLEPELDAENQALVFEWCDEDRPTGGDEDRPSNDEESPAGGEESSAGNDDRVRLLPKLSTLFEGRSIK